MDHFPRFPRRKKCSTAGSTATTSESLVTPPPAKAVTNADVASDQMSLKCHKDGAHASTTSIVHTIVPSSSAPTATTPVTAAPTTTTSPLGKQASASVRPPPQHKRNPFERAFRRTQKRARDASPASLPNSPATVVPMGYGAAVGPSPNMSEAIPLTAGSESSATANENDRVEAPQRKPSRMPAFLELCEQDIGRKFDTLNWLERRRIALGDRDPRWQPVQDPCARFLDRYNNIWPWNNSRIRLQVPEGFLDYINASPITLEAQPRPARPATAATVSSRDPERFIAMQGPKGITIGHAWRMVVEQVESPGVIVMLTETHEGPLEKCFPYFPRSPDHPPLELDRHAEFGDDFRASVRCEEIEPTPAGDAIELRKLVVRVYKQRGKRADQEHEEPSRQEAGCATRTASEKQSQQAAPGEDVDVKGRWPQSEKCSPEVPSTVDHDLDVQMLSPVKEKASVNDTIPAGLGQSCNGDGEPQAFLPVEAELDKEMPSQPPQDPGGGGEAQDYEDRVIWHLLYKKWPDYGVPDLADLDSFFTLMRLSREKNARPENPRVVHCSAGVGRSGTFIALDYLMRELDAGTLENWDNEYQQWQEKSAAADAPSFPMPSQSSPSLLNLYHPASAASRRISMPAHLSMMLRPLGGNGGMTTPPPDPSLMRGDDLIFSTVNRLREQRRQMVQAEMQYVFIYQVMRKLWQDRYCEEKEAGEPAAKRLVVDPFVEG